MARTGAIPEPSRQLEQGQWATPVPVRLPYPPLKHAGSIYEIQRELKNSFFTAKPEKVAAREMMKMVAKINNDFLANVKTSRATRVTVECATCHHGVAVPQRIESILLDTAKSDGVAAAKSRWLELEEKYGGRAAYDFGFPPLVQVAEDLESAEKVADAAVMADFAVERFPTEAWPRLAAADLHAKLGEKEAAIAGIRKVLEMDPGNGMAKRMLEKLQAPTE